MGYLSLSGSFYGGERSGVDGRGKVPNISDIEAGRVFVSISSFWGERFIDKERGADIRSSLFLNAYIFGCIDRFRTYPFSVLLEPIW